MTKKATDEKKLSILITGASSYLGRELANYFSKKENYKVFLTSRTEHDFSKLIEQYGVKYLPNIDLINEEHLKKLKLEIQSYFENQFIIVNSLGYFRAHEPFGNTDLSEAKKMIESQYLALYGVIHTLLPLMKKQKGGHIIAFSCNSVKYRYPYMSSFISSKAAVESLIGCIANEFGNYNILANTLALSSLQTPFVKKSKPYGDYDHYLRLNDICKLVEQIIKLPFRIMNGNTISLYDFSKTFFNKGYFQRIKS